jgi:hypothetical protein
MTALSRSGSATHPLTRKVTASCWCGKSWVQVTLKDLRAGKTKSCHRGCSKGGYRGEPQPRQPRPKKPRKATPPAGKREARQVEKSDAVRRLHLAHIPVCTCAEPRFTARDIGIGQCVCGRPHPDLMSPANRARAYERWGAHITELVPGEAQTSLLTAPDDTRWRHGRDQPVADLVLADGAPL